jgi:hypothetical protein
LSILRTFEREADYFADRFPVWDAPVVTDHAA